MRTPTPEQQAVLNNLARVRVVRAVPGSGKTWMVAELIRQELGDWPLQTCGIAALSFTRVGGDEIRKALGHDLEHPHFVGTIDAFLFRYVVRPFLQKCFPSLAAPRLIPGEWGAEHWSNYSRNQKATDSNGVKVNLFGCVFIDEENGKAVVAHKPHPAQPLHRLSDPELSQVKAAKMDLWKRSGRLTHSDAAMWASKILEHEAFGTTIRAELIQRFPLIVVDELQDTGYFLGKSIRLLLGESAARSVLVGDPDQAIYEFNGARPDLFNSFESIEGAVTLRLSNSLRFGSSVAAVASHLKDSGGDIGTSNDRTGRTVLVHYSDMVADMPRVVDATANVHGYSSIKVIARHADTVEALSGRGVKSAVKLGSPPLNHMQRAVVAFRQGRQTAALAAARAAIELVVFKYEGVEDTVLEEHNIEPSRWKRLAVECLQSASNATTTGNLYNWQTTVGRILDEKLGEFDLGTSLQFSTGKLKPKKLEKWEDACTDYLPAIGVSEIVQAYVPVQTVHGVKGETHNITIFVCRDTQRATNCPSVKWWSEDERDREEKRIAYVAMTRTRGDLIVCVSDDCYQRLYTSRMTFVDNFECMSVDEWVASLGQSGDANPTASPHIAARTD